MHADAGRLELYGRDTVRSSSRVSNPGCYATNNQLLLAPLMPYLDRQQSPSVFGLSGYSGAGTKSGEKDEEGRPKTVPKVVSFCFAPILIMTRADASRARPTCEEESAHTH